MSTDRSSKPPRPSGRTTARGLALSSVLSSALIWPLSSGAAATNACAAIPDNTQRLACYDQAFGHEKALSHEKPHQPGTAPGYAAAEEVAPARGSAPPAPAGVSSKMIDDWDVAPDNARRLFEIRPYKPVYLLLGTYTDNINRQPSSRNPVNALSSPIAGLSATEAQFQLSFKTKVWGNLFGDNGNLWLGYTQSSRWQVYSGQISRPFRETNYEPEAMLMFRTPFALGDWKLRMSGVALNHQSNGRSNPMSRSWNRIIGHLGIENGDLGIQIRPWLRVKEDAAEDNNPDIENYVGRGELIVTQRLAGHIVSLTGRHSLRRGEEARGSIKLDWAIPISGNLKGHLSLFSGYGESLIDFNHRQTMLGAGLSLVEW